MSQRAEKCRHCANGHTDECQEAQGVVCVDPGGYVGVHLIGGDNHERHGAAPY